MPRKWKDYDDRLLVLALARGTETLRVIAERFGLNHKYVQCIARGRARPELLPKIQAARQRMEDETVRLGSALVRGMMLRHVEAGLTGEGETARKCREYALDRALQNAQPRGTHGRQAKDV